MTYEEEMKDARELVEQLTVERLSRTFNSRFWTSETTSTCTVGTERAETVTVSAMFCTTSSAPATWNSLLGVNENVPVPAAAKS